MVRVYLGLKLLILPHSLPEKVTEFWFIFHWYSEGVISSDSHCCCSELGHQWTCHSGRVTVYTLCLKDLFFFIVFSVVVLSALVTSSPQAFSLRILPLPAVPVLFVGNSTCM